MIPISSSGPRHQALACGLALLRQSGCHGIHLLFVNAIADFFSINWAAAFHT
jgi:hypothetical protein